MPECDKVSFSWHLVVQLRVNVNDGASFAPMNIEQLAVHFERVELPLKAHSTIVGYKNYPKLHSLDWCSLSFLRRHRPSGKWFEPG